ncbi:radical SAM protein [Streptomyces diastatochromogenes]|uniref:radical SAM protein n=1 Tax=Streptomyces diastatochromogenes TaxID=42236 RepID=UPI003650921B
MQQVSFTNRKPTDDPRADQFRQARDLVLGSLGAYRIDEPRTASTAYVWPTAICPVGCGHCNFAAPPNVRDLARPRITRFGDDLLAMLRDSQVWKAVLSGGGEPMMEPEFCKRFIAEVSSSALEEIELITSAHFAGDLEAARDTVAELAAAWRGRTPAPQPVSFTVRISVDWFHAARIGLEPAANLITILAGDEYQDIGFYVRSVLLDGDRTMSDLAALLGGELSEIEDYQQTIRLPDGRDILIYYKNLILDGRITKRKLDRLPVGMPDESRSEEFGKRFATTAGRHIPARTYNGPVVRQLDGLAMIFEDDGAVKILEGNAPDRIRRLGDLPSWAAVMDHYYADPITVFLVQEGPDALAQLVSERYPDAVSVGTEHNELYHLASRILETPERALYATLRVLDQHLASGLVNADPDVLAKAWELLQETAQT